MIVYNFGTISYLEAMKEMKSIHQKAIKDGKNHLILCSHPLCYTVGKDEDIDFGIDTIKSDRGGSVTCHSEGQLVIYFCFQAQNPALFYRKVIKSINSIFDTILPSAKYSKDNPGWYIDKRKISSLGFRYSKGVSMHGVAINNCVDLKAHNIISPCNLSGIEATSLQNEGIDISMQELTDLLIDSIAKNFDED